MSFGDAGIGLSEKEQKDRRQSASVSPLSRMGAVTDTAQNEAKSIGDAYNTGGFGAAVGRGMRAFGAVTGQAAKQFAMNQMQGVMPIMQGTAQAYKTMTTGDPTPVWQAPTQQASGGGTVVQAATQNEEQQQNTAGEPVAITKTAKTAVEQPAATGSTTETRQIGGAEANVTLNPNNRVTKVVSGDPNSPGPYGMVELVDPNAKARGLPTAEQLAEYQNQQAAMRRYGNIMRPNGESDRDFNANSQVVITPGRGRATNNPGYTFVGGAGDAARFFQPVGRPGGYNPYKQRFRTLFDEQMDARRAAQNAPSQAEPQGPMGWKRLRDKMNNESRERIAEMTGGFGLTQAGLQDARAREQLAQQYGINMAQLGNDNLRTQAALGLSGLQQQAQQLQLAQAARLNAAQEKMMNARPGSKEWLENRSIVQALSGNNGQGNQTHVLGNDVEGKYLAETYTGEDGRTYQRRIPEEGGQPDSTIFEGDQLDQALKADPDFAKKHKKAKTEAERKAREREWILNRRANL